MLAFIAASLLLSADKPVVVLLPLTANADLQDTAYATSLRLQEALERTSLLLLHPKQVQVVADAARVTEARYSTPADAKRVSERLGASHAIFGEVRHGKTSLELVLSLSVAGAAPVTRSLSVSAGDNQALLDKAQHTLAELLGAVISAEAGAAIKAQPSYPAGAFIDYAACHRALTRQGVSLRAPVVLDVESRVGAVKRCTAATQAAPQLKQAFAALGFARALVSEREEAEAALALSKGSDMIPYYIVGKFWVLSRFHDGAAAAEFLKEATNKTPGFLLGRGYLGEALNALKRHDDALGVFRAYAADVPKQPWVRAQIGYTLAKLGKVAEGIEASKDALSLAPDEVELTLELASRFIDAQRYEEAQRMLESRARDPNARGELLLRLGYAHLMLGHTEDAEKWFKLAIERAQGPREWRTRGRARYDLARLAAKRGDKKAALDELERAFSEGYKDVQKLSGEKDFDSLRTDPRFIALGSKPRPTQLKLPLFASPFAHDPLSGEAPSVVVTKPELQKKAVEVRF